MALVLRIVCVFAVLGLGACATFEPQPPIWPYPEPPDGVGAEEMPSSWPDEGSSGQMEGKQAEPSSGNAAVSSLVAQAQSEAAAGDLERAAATLERALRVAPQDPIPWYELARVRFEQGNLIQAENLARRSLSFAGQSPGLQIHAWELIADIKALQGDTAAEAKARERARQARG